MPPSADLALFFWWKAAQALLLNKHRLRRFGFITSNSIRQTFCRRVVAAAMEGKRRLRLVFAIPDHPWSDGAGSAAVRIALTVAERDDRRDANPVLQRVVAETATADGVPSVELAASEGPINADLSIGADPDMARPLRANERISSPGVKLHSAGFIVTPAKARALGLGRIADLECHIRSYLNGRDLTQRSRGMMVIDLFGLDEPTVRRRFGEVWQHLHYRVLQDRAAIADRGPDAAEYARLWWLHGKPRPELRRALDGLPCFIATPVTAKHRLFCFLNGTILPDDALIAIASDDAFHLGVLSSRIHVAWTLAAGGTLEDRPRYNKTRCFDPFPFPDPTQAQRAQIAALAEELDTLRRTRLDAHPHLTMTGLYNVLEALRQHRPLTDAEKDIDQAGHVSILKHLHDQLDVAAAAAYGWPADLPAAEIVARIVALNIARRAEEAEGTVRWLRPAYQAPAEPIRAAQPVLDIRDADADALPPWPKSEADRYVALRTLLATMPGRPEDLSRRFRRAPVAKVRSMLETLSVLGQARRDLNGSYRV